jgi:hypothetical protein
MRKVVLICLLAILAVAVGAGFIWRRSTRAMAVQVNVRDIPEHGLRLIGPADPSFKGMATSLLRAKPDEAVEALLPFSVLVKNTGNRTVVAYQLKWEVVRADGKVFTRTQGHLVPGVLKGEEDVTGVGGKSIRPNSAWLCSLSTAPLEVSARKRGTYEPTGSGGVFSSLHGGGDQEEVKQALQTGDHRVLQDVLVNELKQASSLTVSLEGAFFDDGSFVGPDSTGFFDRVKAILEAEHDFLAEISLGVKERQDTGAIFRHIQELANTSTAPLGPAATPGDLYAHYKKRYASKLLRARGYVDDERLIARTLLPLRKKWLMPHKQE